MMAPLKRRASSLSSNRTALRTLRKKPYVRPVKGARRNLRHPHISSRYSPHDGLEEQDVRSTRDEVPDHAKPAKNPQRPVVPFEGVQIGQWYSAAVDIERQGKKTWGGVKHRILVTAKDESLHTLSCVFNTTFGGTSPEEFTQKKTSKGKSTRPRETWEYLPTPSTRRLVSIPTYDTVRSYPPVIKGFVNFSSIIKVRCNPGVKARELPRVIPEAKPKLLVGPVRDPKLAGQYEPVCSPDYTRVYMNHLRSEFTVLDRTNSKSDWVRTAAVVLQRLSKERKIELELWEEEWTGFESDEKNSTLEVTGGTEDSDDDDNDHDDGEDGDDDDYDDDYDDGYGRDDSVGGKGSVNSENYSDGDQNQRGDGRSEREVEQGRRSGRERYSDSAARGGRADRAAGGESRGQVWREGETFISTADGGNHQRGEERRIHPSDWKRSAIQRLREQWVEGETTPRTSPQSSTSAEYPTPLSAPPAVASTSSVMSGVKKTAYTTVTMRLYMMDLEDPVRALPSSMQQLIEKCCPREDIPPP